MKVQWMARGLRPSRVTSSKESVCATLTAAESIPETGLIAAAQQGSEKALQLLFDRNARDVYSLCLHAVRQPAKAEDLTRLAFLNAFRKITNVSSESEFSASLRRAALSGIIGCLKESHREAKVKGAPAILDQTAAGSKPCASS